MDEQYDVVVIGSGLGGLVSANILAKEGYKVCILEKNNQYGGNLQTFARDKTIFDTGVHYIGGLSEGQNLYKYFKYLEIMDDLQLKKLDEEGFDIITFEGDETEYKHAQGYVAFIKTLVEQFPEEEEGIRAYCQSLKDTCHKFPLYELRVGSSYYEDLDIFEIPAKTHINSFTSNKKLQAVLAGTNFLYAGDSDKTPFYVHALSINSYIERAYRCINGGSQISKVLIRKLKENGGHAFKRHEVTKFCFEDQKITSVLTANGKEIKGKLFISNVDPKGTLRLVGRDRFRKSYYKRVQNIESIIAGFSLYIVLKPGSFKYLNKNYYHVKDYTRIWELQDYEEEKWPEGYMVSMGIKKHTDQWGDSLTIMTYMKYDEVAPWENTFNTAANKNERGQTYEEFKAQKAERLLQEVEKKFPNIRDCIKAMYTSTPLSYRDYIGIDKGSIYGYVKDVNNPLRSFISPKTKIKNLYFTGQCLNMHGILGVTISGVITCSEILGREYLVNKIVAANTEKVMEYKDHGAV